MEKHWSAEPIDSKRMSITVKRAERGKYEQFSLFSASYSWLLFSSSSLSFCMITRTQECKTSECLVCMMLNRIASFLYLSILCVTTLVILSTLDLLVQINRLLSCLVYLTNEPCNGQISRDGLHPHPCFSIAALDYDSTRSRLSSRATH